MTIIYYISAVLNSYLILTFLAVIVSSENAKTKTVAFIFFGLTGIVNLFVTLSALGVIKFNF